MKRVAFLSFVAALGGILFGYDTAVISGTISAVAERFALDAMAKGWYVGCALVGSIGGVAVAGWLSDRFGRKPTMLFSSVLFSVSAIGCAICLGFADLVVYRIVGGVGIGRLTDTICELQKMYCLPDARGSGVAHQLMDTALAYAKKYYRQCYLETLENMTAAQKFYEKYGFVRVFDPPVKTEHFSCDVRYIKDL